MLSFVNTNIQITGLAVALESWSKTGKNISSFTTKTTFRTQGYSSQHLAIVRERMPGTFGKIVGKLNHLWGAGTAGSLRTDAILTSKFNKPFPVTLIPSAIGYYLGLKQGERQAQVLHEIRALGEGNMQEVKRLDDHPR